jgi:hypothetical protein
MSTQNLLLCGVVVAGLVVLYKTIIGKPVAQKSIGVFLLFAILAIFTGIAKNIGTFDSANPTAFFQSLKGYWCAAAVSVLFALIAKIVSVCSCDKSACSAGVSVSGSGNNDAVLQAQLNKIIASNNQNIDEFKLELQRVLTQSLNSFGGTMAEMSNTFAKDYKPITEGLNRILANLDRR